MRSLLRPALASLGCAVLAACSDQPTSVSNASTELRPNLDVTAQLAFQVITPCDISALRTDARLYANRSNDVLLSIIGDLGSLVRNGPTTGGNDKAFDGLSRMAAIRGTSDQKPGVTGAVFDRLVKRFVGCMQPAIYAGVLEPDPPTTATRGGGFKQALGDGWVFEVRGKATDPATAAFERGAASPTTWWAVDKRAASWAGSINSALPDRVLIFGWRTSTFIPSNDRAGSAFEHRTIPDVNKLADPGTDFLLDVNVGLCFLDEADIITTQRVNHDSRFLPLSEDINCNTPPTPISANAGSLALGPLNPVRLAQRAAGFFWPQPLHAATMFFGGSITGRPDDFSPSAVYDLSQIKLVFDTIANGFVDTPLTATGAPAHEVRVYAFSLDNTPVPIPGVDVVVKIAGNSSTISFFGGTSNADATITADSVIAKGTPEGYAKLTGVTVTKAGGYNLSARVNVVGVVGSTLFQSLSFNIQNKTGP